MQDFIFDLDGTLLNSAPTSGWPMVHAIRDVTGIELSHEEVLRHMDGFDHTWYLKAYGISEEQNIEIRKKMHENFQKNDAIHGEPPLFEGAILLLDELREKGARLHVCSARAIPNIEEHVTRLGLRDRFTHLMGRTHWGHEVSEKAEVLCERIATLGMDASQCVMIGDMPGDVRAGKTAGTLTVGVTYGFAPRWYLEPSAPDYLVDSIQELRALLLKLLGV